MSRRCKYCFAVLGLCFVSCREAQGDAHDHSAHPADETDFVSFLAAETPAEHVQHMYNASGSTESIYTWMMDVSSAAACMKAEEAGHDDHEVEHDGHDHRRLLELPHDDHDDHDDHAHDEEQEEEHEDHDDHADHGPEDEHGHEEAETAARVLAAESLQAISESAGSDSVKEALAYITACLIDPGCALERSPAAIAAAEAEDEHDEHDDHGSSGAGNHVGLKVGLAFGFFFLTVIASYVPLLFMKNKNYSGILSCFNAFSGATFLAIGVIHLLPHVTDYEGMSDLDTDYPVGLTIVVIGFLCVLFVEQVLFIHSHDGGDDDAAAAAQAARDAESEPEGGRTLKEQAQGVLRKYHSPLVAEAAVVFHAVLESMVLGLTGSKDTLWLFFWAIVSHKGFASMSQSTRFLRLGCPPGLLFLLMAPFHILPALAVILGSAVGNEDPVASLVLTGLATGTFIYIGAFEVVAEEFVHFATATPAVIKGAAGGEKAGTKSVKDKVEESEEGCSGCEDDAKASAAGWYPSRAVKFAVFVFGCGVMFAITAGLPSHDELHAH